MPDQYQHAGGRLARPGEFGSAGAGVLLLDRARAKALRKTSATASAASELRMLFINRVTRFRSNPDRPLFPFSQHQLPPISMRIVNWLPSELQS